ncbi:MAG: DUF2380 domain-containing protein [Gammaproteobacteria bacterium]
MIHLKCNQLLPVTGLIILLLAPVAGYAELRIAVLDFELNDLTLAPRILSEVERTAGIKALLEGELSKAGYKLVRVDAQAQLAATAGFGYLFDHDDAAAELAKQAGADYVLVGRLHKPSFLFAYIMGHLIRVADARLIGNYISETKGSDKKLMLKGVESLAAKINNTLAAIK